MASQSTPYKVEHLNHLGIVAEVCREIGVAEWLDQHDPTNRQYVSVGKSTVAMVLNGLGFSNRQLYLVPQFFADKPVEHLLGEGITAEDLHDDCLGRTLDWLYEHDVTALFAGLAQRARQVFGVQATTWHGDTTSFSVHGQYAHPDDQPEEDEALIEVTYGYSRDHREDLKQWMLAIITSGEGVPLFLRPLSGNASDKRSLREAVLALREHLKDSDEEPGVYVADSGLYSTENMTTIEKVSWISRVPETLTLAQAMVREEPELWQPAGDQTHQWWSRVVNVTPERQERWIVVRSQEGETRARATMQRQAERDQETWTKRLWHLSHRTFACEADAHKALAHELRRCPLWIQVQTTIIALPKHSRRGRPRNGVAANTIWQLQSSLTVDATALEAEALRRAAFLISTNLLDMARWPDETIIALYREQTVVEKGFAFLKDPLFLASSVFVKKPERIMAIAFIMTLCLLVYKLAEWRVRQQLAATQQSVPNQLKKPTQRPTMRWLFQCFEGIDLLHIPRPDGLWHLVVLRLTDLHRLVLHLLGPTYENCYLCFSQSAE